MTMRLEAVYENGVFRPLTRPADDAREMRAIVDREFEGVDLREWQYGRS